MTSRLTPNPKIKQKNKILIRGFLRIYHTSVAVTNKLYTSNLANLISKDKIFLTVVDAVAYCSPKVAKDP